MTYKNYLNLILLKIVKIEKLFLDDNLKLKD